MKAKFSCLVLILISARFASLHAEIVVVRPGSPGWFNAGATFVPGPGSPPLGVGSARFQTGTAGEKPSLFLLGLEGRLVNDIKAAGIGYVFLLKRDF